MAATRTQVSNRRTALFMSLLTCVTLFVIFPILIEPVKNDDPPRSILFGDISDWPHDVSEGWLPLDFLVAFASAYFLLLIALTSHERGDDERTGLKYWLKYACGVFIVFGGLGGMMGSIIEGWLNGIEFFFAMGLMAWAAIAFFGCAILAILGLGWLLRGAGRALMKTRFFRPIASGFRRAGNYLEAKDIPAPEEDEEEDAPQTA